MSNAPPLHAPAKGVLVIHSGPQGETPISLSVAEEVPVAFRYNGFPYAVMMATPADIEEFALGFSLTEGLIEQATDIRELAVAHHDDGLRIDISLRGESLHRYLARRRVRALRGHTSCGLCGVEDLEAVRRPFTPLPPPSPPSPAAIERAAGVLHRLQPLSLSTRAAHAAAWIDPDGAIQCVREDIGRHNSLDKLIGAGLRGAFNSAAGFCLITSRCSFEMAQKAIAAGFPVLVSISAPTALAIRTASAAGLLLYSLDRSAGQFLYTTREPREAANVLETQAWTRA